MSATQIKKQALLQYSANLGLAFQIKDDILDVIGDSSILGKKVGSDEANNKSTFVSIYGVERSQEMLRETTEKAKNAINETFAEKGEFLIKLAEYLLDRSN